MKRTEHRQLRQQQQIWQRLRQSTTQLLPYLDLSCNGSNVNVGGVGGEGVGSARVPRSSTTQLPPYLDLRCRGSNVNVGAGA